MIPPFDQHVSDDGYAWWYLDAISHDQRYGLTLIAFIGSVFSPYYAWARSRGPADPLAHCAINVALYGPGRRWSMTERGRAAVKREPASLKIGPSGLRWNGQALDIDVREWAVPIPRRILGRIRVEPEVTHNQGIDLDPQGRHRWTPVWPSARVTVSLDHPRLRWTGEGYFDHNRGSEPLSCSFEDWSWSRAATRHGPVVLYDLQLKTGIHKTLALRFDDSGQAHALPCPKPVQLPTSRWGIARPTRAEEGDARLEEVWEDTPFYTRSRLNTVLMGERVTAIHESLSLRRFSSRWVQLMLPFRMPRKAG